LDKIYSFFFLSSKSLKTNLWRKNDGRLKFTRLTEKKLVITSEAGERGTLYGSISARDIAKLFSQDENVVLPNQVLLANPIKEVGVYPIVVELHPQVVVTVEVVVKSVHV
jgi:large subunit ribosomal protein L9